MKKASLLFHAFTLLPLAAFSADTPLTYTVTPTGELEVAADVMQPKMVQPDMPQLESHASEYQVSILSDVANKFNLEQQQDTHNVALKNIRLAVDTDNASLKEIINNIIGQAEVHTGPWNVKWRLKPENQHILNQKVNLIAEGTFSDFAYHLTDRVKNMTGTQLFISSFDTARVIIISDTVY